MADYTSGEQAAITRLALYNGNYYDQSSNPYGFSGIGYKTNFPQSLNDVALVLPAAKRQADAAATSATAAAAVSASRPKATSTTSVAIGTSGTRTFTTAENLITSKPIFDGDAVKVYVTADSTKFMLGRVTGAPSANSLTIAVLDGAGSGTYSAWTIIVQGERGAATGIANVQADTSPMLGGNLVTGAYVISVSTGGGISMASGSNGLSMNGAPINDARMNVWDEAAPDLGTVSNTVAVSPTGGPHKHCVLGGNATFALSGGPAAGGKSAILLEIAQPVGGTNTIAFTGVDQWVGGAAPSAPAAGKRMEILFTKRYGDVWIGRQQWTGVPV